MANEISMTVCAHQFEVAVVGCKPCVKHLGDVDATVSKNQRAWRLLAAVARVALDTNWEGSFLLHPITMRR